MIKRDDITKFFDLEADSQRNSWEALMKLPTKDRIRKRKAIKDVYIDRDFADHTEDGDSLYQLHVNSNLSDFKEGDYLLLHEEDKLFGMKCTLFSFENDDIIYVSVSIFDRVNDLESYYDKPLILDKDLVDLRQHIFYNFTAVLPNNSDYWNNSLINQKPSPKYIEDIKCIELFEDLVKNINILDNQHIAIKNSLLAQDYYLIQGPPGTGKSFVLGLIILMELMHYKHKIVVIGPNHMAINNALGQVFDLCPNLGDLMPFYKVGRPYNAPSFVNEYEGKEYKITNAYAIKTGYLNSLEHPWLMGLTPHSLYTSKARGLKCDTLIIDEAGQMTIPLALMGMFNCKKVILAGDHKQLPPIITSEQMPEYLKKSVFEAMITTDNCTLLDTSFRMCGPICEFVSDLFYEGKIKAMNKECGTLVKCNDSLLNFGNPVVVHNVDDSGEQASIKEAEFIVETIIGFLNQNVPAKEIAVLAPFRAQAATVRRLIRKCQTITEEDKNLLVADTVDKMQGQEREIIIYSLTAGNPDYMEEMADFLYMPNKLNVAFSRAKSKLIIVGNIENLKRLSVQDYPHLQKMLEHKNITLI
jgi:superfamily I DNA and/or RNA helicase